MTSLSKMWCLKKRKSQVRIVAITAIAKIIPVCVLPILIF